VGDYVLESELDGRTGERVFASTHVLLPRRARIVIPSEAARAFETARLLERIKHPSVPRIYECGLLPDDRPWLALGMVDGPTLATAIAERPLSIADTLSLLVDIAAILTHAHAHRIVHGEVRADRIVRERGAEGRGDSGWRLLDWAEAGFAHDTATDVHGLGVVAYGALARALPTLPLARRCPTTPRELAQLIDRTIADPPSAAHLLAEATRMADDIVIPLDDDDFEPLSLQDVIVLGPKSCRSPS
jgi:hypothetical protein